MKAVCYYGTGGHPGRDGFPIRSILNPRDAIVKITATAICGSDLHLYDGYIPTMENGDILGHEFMGEVVEVGPRQHNAQGRRPRRRAVHHRLRPLLLLQGASSGRCATTRTPTPGWPRSSTATPARACSATRTCTAAMPAGRPSTCACRSPTSARSRCPTSLTDEQVLFLSDIFPTGYMAAENCDIRAGRHRRGLGLRTGRAVRDQERLPARRRARDRHRPLPRAAGAGGVAGQGRGARTTRRSTCSTRCASMTGGRGPDACIDAVGLEAHGTTLDAWYDRVKTSMYLATDRPHALRQAISACRKGGTVSIPGVYGGLLDKFPLGAAFAKGLTLKMGQTHMHKYLPRPARRVSSAARSIRRSSSRTASDSTRRRRCTGRSATRRTRCIKVVMRPA